MTPWNNLELSQYLGTRTGGGRGAGALSTFILSFSTTVAVETSNMAGVERFPTQ